MEIYKKIAAVKSEIGTLSKNAKNPFFKSDYLDLNGILSAVEPLLEKNGLLLMQPIENGCVNTRIVNTGKTNEWVESSISLPEITDPQKLGSCITYFRRYTLQSLLSLQAVDDDGNQASAKPKISAAQFQKGADQVANSTITIKQFEAKIAKYELTEQQSKSLMLLKSSLV